MTKSKHSFETSQSLLRDVIERQTGSLDKALKELGQNGYDSNSTKIKIFVNSRMAVVINNGRAMTKEEILSVFTTFGESEKRGKGTQRGEFGMGRGQIMPFGLCEWHSGNWKMTVDITNFLGYTLRKSRKYRAGTRVVCIFKNRHSRWDMDRAVNRLRKSFIPLKNMTVFVNEYPLHPILREREQLSNEEFMVFQHEDVESRIFNQGLAVCQISETMHNYCVHVLPKGKLNFARNEFMEGDELTNRLWKFIKECEQKLIIEKPELEFNDAVRVLRMLDRGWLKLDDYLMNKQFIPSSSDHAYSFTEMVGKEILFSARNIWADDCIQQGYIVVHEDIYSQIENIIDNCGLEIEISDEDVKNLARKGYHESCDKHELKGKQVYIHAIEEMNEQVFKPYEDEIREIKLGKSDIADGWTDGYSYIWINKSIILYGQDKTHILMRAWHVLCHEYSHYEDNMKEDYHNSNFYQRYHDITAKTTGRMSTFLNKCNLNSLKKKYNL